PARTRARRQCDDRAAGDRLARAAPLRRERPHRGVRQTVSRVLAAMRDLVGWATAHVRSQARGQNRVRAVAHVEAECHAILPTLRVLCVLATLLASFPARADPVEDFYRGRDI